MKSKSQTTSDKIIAIIVVGFSFVMLLALAIPLMGLNFAAKKTITIDLPTATGLRPNSEIRYAGAPIGKILEVTPIKWEDRSRPGYAVRVLATMDASTPELKKDSEAAISSDTLLAEKFLDLSPGTAASPALADGETIYSKQVASFDDLTREGMVTLHSVNEIMMKVKEEHPEFLSSIVHFVETADTLATNADSLVDSLSIILEGNEEDLNQTSKDLYVVMQNLKVVSTYSKALTATLGRKPWRVVWGTRPNDLPTEDEILKSEKPIKFKIPVD